MELLRKQPGCVSTIQAVLIDEYQDTNNVQYELMKLLAQARGHITIVGDPDQSIYSFRAAEIQNLHRMRKDYPDSSVINLEMNYRSSGCILTSAMAVIEQDEARIDKTLIATHCVGEQPTLRQLATAQIEAQWVVEEIQRTNVLTAGLLNYNDYAILLRSAALSLSIERALARMGIPYRMVGGLRFFDRAEIKLVLDYLRIIDQPDSNDVLARIINRPSRRIGETTVKALVREADEEKMTLWTLILRGAQGKRKPRSKISQPAQLGIDTFVNLILTAQKKLHQEESCDLLSIIGHVINKIQLENYLKSTYKDDSKERWANVEELVNQATQLATSVANGEEVADDTLPSVEGLEQRQDTAADILSKFLANVTLSSAIEQPGGDQVNQVTISTIHAAKGLEWPVVFIPAVYMGSIPHSRAEDHDEERRLLYVGMTRAKGLLYLSCPVKLASSEDTVLSKFLDEPGIEKFFGRAGPAIGCPAIRDLAQILRRPCPSSEEVQTACRRLERMEDDKYPLTRDDIEREGSFSSGAFDGNTGSTRPYSKRLKSHHAGVDAQRTSSTAEHPSDHPSAQVCFGKSTGFASARDISIQQQRAGDVYVATGAEGLTSRQTFSEVRVFGASGRHIHGEIQKPGASTDPTRRAKKRAADQGAITGFFKRTVSNPEKQERSVLIERELSLSRSAVVTSHGPLTDVSNRLGCPPLPYQPYQPPSFPNHSIRNVPMNSKPKKSISKDAERSGHMVMSSSPTKPADETQPTEPTKSTFRPASTLHSTSMNQVQNQNQRRTLGTRRSIQGWSVKHTAPPRPRSGP